MTEEEVRVPHTVMRVLPDDPFEQLDLARKIASMALANRLSVLEGRVTKLAKSIDDKDVEIEDIQKRILDADQAVQRANIRILKTTDDQLRLAKENELLHGTIIRLKQDVSKMEVFRKSLVQSLQLDGSSQILEGILPPQDISKLKSTSSTISPRSPLQTPPKSPRIPVDDSVQITAAADDARRRMLLLKARPNRKSMSDFGLQQYELEQSAAKRGIPLISPPQSPPRTSPPKSRSATGSPKKPLPPVSPLIPSRHASFSSTASSSPPRSPMVPLKFDGKEFFRQAKSRLSYDQFRALLGTIKELNSHKQTREDALRKAEEIFGTENNDLYGFLCQHLPS